MARIQASGELQQNDTPLSIGGRLDSGQDLKGSIDEVMLYNRALIPEEVETISEGGDFLSVVTTITDTLSVMWSQLKVLRLR